MNFVTIDFETANYARKSACSVGMVKYQNGKKVDTFYSLIRPPKLYIRPDFTAIHGLTAEDVKDAPTFVELWDSHICQFLDDLPVAAHNAHFDIGVLLATLEWHGIRSPDLLYFCSLQLARRTWPSFKSHALSDLAKKFNIEYKAHHALDDAETCGKIILMAAENYKSTNLQELLRSANRKMMMVKGTRIEQLSQDEINQLLAAVGAKPLDDDGAIDFGEEDDNAYSL